MHYALHMLFHCIALWCAISGGRAARSAVSPEILANFAKNVASVISPAILGDVQQRNNRSSFQSILTIPIRFNAEDPDSPSTLDNVVDRTNNAANYYEPRSNPYPYDDLYGNPPVGDEQPRANGGLEQPLPEEETYLRQGREPSFYNHQPYYSPNDNFRATEKPAVDDVESSIGSIEQSPTSQYSAYAGGFPKGGFGPYLGKPYGGFHGSYGHYGHYHPYDDDGGSSEENARVENNGTNHRYGPPHFGPHGYHHGPYGGAPFPYGGHGGGYGSYGPYHRNGNDTGNGDGRNGQYGYGGPYHGGHDFYGPSSYGYDGYGYGNGNGRNGNGNGNGNSQRQTEEPAGNGDRDNGTKNGYPHPYGPPLKPLFHHFPPPFNIVPYDHFHFKGAPVAGAGHVGYPIFADPYLIGYPFHFPYGPLFPGKKYLPPKKPADSGETTEQPGAGELANNENPERITGINQEEVAPAPTSNRYKTSERKGLKRLSLVGFESRKI